jgi:hypothetical protein
MVERWCPKRFTLFVTAELARRYKTEGINAYVDLIQNKERELGVDIITHQKWSVPLFYISVPPRRSYEPNAGVELIILTVF